MPTQHRWRGSFYTPGFIQAKESITFNKLKKGKLQTPMLNIKEEMPGRANLYRSNRRETFLDVTSDNNTGLFTNDFRQNDPRLIVTHANYIH